MKILLALAFLAVVSAIPRPEQIPSNIEGPKELEPPQGAGDGDIEVGNPKDAPPSEQPNNPEEDDEDEDDEDDSDNRINLDDLIKALSSIRNALKQKIQDKLDHNSEDSEDDVPSQGAPENEDAPQQGNASENEGPSSNVTGYATTSDPRPKINITLIKQEIHDKIENIITNILGPLLGNNSVEDGNATTADPPQQSNNTELGGSGSGNETVTDAPQTGNETLTDAPQPGHNTVTPPNEDASNATEVESSSENQVIIVNTSTTEAAQPQRRLRYSK